MTVPSRLFWMPVAEDNVYLAVENAAGHCLKLLRTTENPDKSSVGICVQRNFEARSMRTF